jgi:UDP-glucose 6-dehydrogenase
MAPPVYLGWESAQTEKNTLSSYIVTRLSIVNHIRKQCESKYADRITFADGYTLIGGNLAEG